jgi:hypothetical protein
MGIFCCKFDLYLGETFLQLTIPSDQVGTGRKSLNETSVLADNPAYWLTHTRMSHLRPYCHFGRLVKCQM